VHGVVNQRMPIYCSVAHEEYFRNIRRLQLVYICFERLSVTDAQSWQPVYADILYTAHRKNVLFIILLVQPFINGQRNYVEELNCFNYMHLCAYAELHNNIHL